MRSPSKIQVKLRSEVMPKIIVDGMKEFECEAGTKLVLAIEDAGIPILHRCGGFPGCTTCRVEILEGEVSPMQEDEESTLEEPELIEKYRLSCQIRVQNDLKVRVWGVVGTPTPGGKLYEDNGDRPED
jgi:ferredoxin